MAAGSREIYALDLNDIFAFPDGENVPIKPPNTAAGESWVMLLEVGLLPTVSNTDLCGNMEFSFCEKIKDFPPSRQRYVAVDITGKWFTVMINTSNPSLDTADYESGYTLCILNAEPLFGPNYINYEVNDISTVEVRFSNCFFSAL